ncbi:MAG: transcriptional regulator, AraC family [Actinomycetia bacterium]|nr:transcriptional regulator, AraC family [Actinomycetes bacterium]
MTPQPLARHLLRARDLADARYAGPLTVADMARAAGLSQAYFSREFKRAFGESPHQYLLTRRLERAATLLRVTDWSVAEVCFAVARAASGPSRPASAGSSAARPWPTDARGRRRSVSSGFPAA